MKLFYGAFLLAFGLAGPAALALEKFAAVENVELRMGSLDLRIPRLALENTPFTKEELAALFAKGAASSLAERLARVSAERALIPEAVGESAAGEKKSGLLLKNMRLEKIIAGRVGGFRLASIEERLRDKPQSAPAWRGEDLSATGLDLTRLARLLAGEGAAEQEPPVADAAALEQLAVSADDGAFALAAARLSTRRPRLGPLPQPAWRRLSGETSEPGKEVEIVDGILAAIAFEAFEAHDLSVAGRVAPTDADYAIGARGLAFEGLEKGVARKARLASFSSKSADGGRLTVGTLAFEGLDIGAALTRTGLRALHFDKARLERLLGDAPAPDGRGRTKFALDSAAVELGHFRDGAPTQAAARFQGLRVDLSARGEEASAAFLRSLGYSTLEFSGAGDAQWRDASREFEVSKLSLDAKDMFALSVRLKLSNVDGALFSAGPLVAASQLMAVRLDRVEATLADAKLFDRLIEHSARESGGDPARVRATYAHDMRRAILGALDESDKAKRIAAAVERFILNRGRLRIALTAPQGFGVMDLLKSPPEILQGLEVEAAAE